MASGAQGRTELVTFVLDGRRWALPLGVVERAVPMVAVSALPEAPAGVLGAINVHGEIVPVFDLRGRAGLPPRAPRPEDQLLLARTTRRVALAVDEMVGVLELQLEWSADTGPVAVLPDGLVAILDLDAFLSAEDALLLDEALA